MKMKIMPDGDKLSFHIILKSLLHLRVVLESQSFNKINP